MPRGIYIRKRRPLADRFWEKVDIRGPDNCWGWTACKIKDGYGLIIVDNKVQLATHVLFYLRKGYWPPKGRTANHHCDNPSCLNPRHLYLGTMKSNMCDKYQRGRGNHPKGEQNSNSKLTEKKVRKIKRLYSGGVIQIELARRFGVNSGTISYIVNNKQWKHVGGQ